jgi:hypothetical protein
MWKRARERGERPTPQKPRNPRVHPSQTNATTRLELIALAAATSIDKLCQAFQRRRTILGLLQIYVPLNAVEQVLF